MFRTARLTVLAALVSAVAIGGLGASAALGDDDDHKRGDREHHDREHRDRDRHHRERDHHSHHRDHGHHGHHDRHHWHHDHHRHHHYSHRKPCGHIGACPTRTVRICVRAGYYENRYVPAVTQTCYDSCGHRYTKVIHAAHWTKVWVPPVYETRHVSTCESRHTTWSFSFGF